MGLALRSQLVHSAVAVATAARSHRQLSAAQHQQKLGDKAQSVSSLWGTKQLEYTWLRSLMQRYVNFGQVTQEALDYALESHGIHDGSLRQDLMNAYQQLSCYPEVPDTLGKLRQHGLGTAILSNG